jgi:hypothetical protein
MIGSYLDWLFATVVVVVAGLFTVVTVRHNLRIWRMRRAYKTLPDEVKEQVLRLVQEAAMEHPSVTFLRLNKEAQYNDVKKGDIAISFQYQLGMSPLPHPLPAWLA